MPRTIGSRLARARTGYVFGACLAVVLALQLWTGSYRVERGVYSDDAAHFLNGLVIRDYLTSALGQDPMAFAQDYYLSYPKIAPLMWPPLFHVVLGLFLLPGWPPGAAAIFLVGLTAAWLGWRLYGIVRVLVGPVAAVSTVALTLTTPLVQSLSGAVMLDVAIGAMVLEAAYWLARYAQSSLRRDAILCGIFSACACLTKGNGVAAVLTPVVFILITGRYDLLRRSGLYLAAAIVVVFAVPLLALSARYDAAIGDFGPVTAADVWHRVLFYSGQLWTQMSPLVFALSLCGTALVVARRLKTTDPDAPPLAEALVALLAAGLLFHALNPHTVSINRYVTMAIGPLVALAFIAGWTIVNRVRPVARSAGAGILIALTMMLVAVACRPGLLVNRPLGYREVVTRLAQHGELSGRRLLVVGDEVGEGAFVSEAAVLGLHPSPTIVRGSKLLASDDWAGHDFRMRYASPSALLVDLEALHVSYVLLDLSELSMRLPYFGQVEALARDEPVRFALEYSGTADAVNGPSRSLALYRVTSPSPGPPKALEIHLGYSLGRSLKR